MKNLLVLAATLFLSVGSLAEDASGLEARVSVLETTDSMLNESFIFNDKHRVAYNLDGDYLGEIVREHYTSQLCHIDFVGAGETALIPMYEQQYDGAYAWPMLAAFADQNCTESIVRASSYDKYPNALPRYTHALIQYHIQTDALFVKKVDFSTRFNSDVYTPSYSSRTGETTCELRYRDEDVYPADSQEYYWGSGPEIIISYVDELP